MPGWCVPLFTLALLVKSRDTRDDCTHTLASLTMNGATTNHDLCTSNIFSSGQINFPPRYRIRACERRVHVRTFALFHLLFFFFVGRSLNRIKPFRAIQSRRAALRFSAALCVCSFRCRKTKRTTKGNKSPFYCIAKIYHIRVYAN